MSAIEERSRDRDKQGKGTLVKDILRSVFLHANKKDLRRE